MQLTCISTDTHCTDGNRPRSPGCVQDFRLTVRDYAKERGLRIGIDEEQIAVRADTIVRDRLPTGMSRSVSRWMPEEIASASRIASWQYWIYLPFRICQLSVTNLSTVRFVRPFICSLRSLWFSFGKREIWQTLGAVDVTCQFYGLWSCKDRRTRLFLSSVLLVLYM